MELNLEKRYEEEARYIEENHATIGEAAKKFGLSKTTIHVDVTRKLEKVNPYLAKRVQEVLQVNKDERHLRGGKATQKKYEMLRGYWK